ncbi:MAG TPA: hypothetical protein VF970_03595, partial [Gemmatimonadales bacterium]
MPIALGAGTYVLIASCADPGGPRGFDAHFAIAASFASSAAGIVPIDRARITLIRNTDSTVALDTTVIVNPDSDSLDLSLTVVVFQAAETFTLRLALITPAGDTAFRAGPVTVTPTTGTDPVPVQAPFDYVGTGANAAYVEILTGALNLNTGQTAVLEAAAYDSSNAVIPGTPIAWSSLDTARASVARPDSGRVIAGAQRGAARIVATLLTGPADTGTVNTQPLPTSLVAELGGGQTGVVGATLDVPLGARVLAADGLGVSGVWVRFTVTGGGGALSADSALTDAQGRASVTWTLGPAAGSQTVQATTGALPSASASFGATALAGTAARLAFLVEPSAAIVRAVIAPSVSVAARDVGGNLDLSFTGNMQLAIANNPGGGTLSGTTTVAAVAGVATFADLSIIAAGVGYTLVATAGGLAPDTSVAFAIGAPPVPGNSWINPAGGNWSAGANWSKGVPPSPTDTVFILLDGTYTVTLDQDATVKYLVMGGASGTQTFSHSGVTLTVDSGAVFNPTTVYQLASGVLTGLGPVSFAGGLEWSGGTIGGASVTVIAAGAQATLTGGAKTLGSARSFLNTGTVTWSGGDLALASDAHIQNLPGAFWFITGDASLTQLSGAGPTFSNSGRLLRTISAGLASIGVDFFNSDTLDVQTGTLQFNGVFYNGPSAVLRGTGTLDFSASPNAGFDGAVNPGTSPGILTFLGPVTFGASTINIELGGTTPGTGHDQLKMLGAATLGGSLEVATTGGFTPSDGDRFAVMTYGSRTGAFSSVTLPTVTGLVLDTVWTTGRTPDTLYLAAEGPGLNQWITSSGTWSTDANWSLGRAPIPGDTVEITQGGDYVVNLDVETSIARLTVGSQTDIIGLNAQGRTITVTDAGADALTIGSFGRLEVGPGSLSAVSVTNQGTMEIYDNTTLTAETILNGGTWRILNSSTLTVVGSGTFTNAASGMLAGDGALDLSGTVFTNNGTLSPGLSPGVLGVSNVTMGSSSILNLELQGITAGTQYDQLFVQGNAGVAGTLDLASNFTPAAATSFAVLNYATRTGGFTTITGRDLVPTRGAGMSLDTAWSGTALNLIARGQILFHGDSGGGLSRGIFRLLGDATGRTLITPEYSLTGHGQPRWSPDYKWVTYGGNVSSGNNFLHIATPNGATVYHVVNDVTTRRARFSADGVHIAAECGATYGDVCVVTGVQSPADGQGDGAGKILVTQSVNPLLTGPGVFAWNPTNPDQLAVVRDTTVNSVPTSAIYTVNYDGSNVTRIAVLPEGYTVEGTIDWSPDGTLLAFGTL